MKIFIVESPGKVKKIQGFLGSDWKVVASVGHVRDLPVKGIGVKAPHFKPEYEATERGQDVLKRIAPLVKNAEAVYLATDPDREGEAIAWHLMDALKLKNAKRITYTEITAKAIKAALAHPRSIDMDLVAAQEGRRVLDRLCGYMVSGPLSDLAAERLSAGRVQSPAVRLVVERENEIKNFVVTKHFGAELLFKDDWKAVWKPVLPNGQTYMLDLALAEKAAATRSLRVASYEESETKSAPPAPFTTSTLQQAASTALKFGPKQTMQLAQRLYEAGHITYMRTDSPNISKDAENEARAYCEAQGWPVVKTPRHWKAKGEAQEAHEAIRPTHIEVEAAGETGDERALYRLIRLRTLAAMLADAIYAVRTVQMTGGGFEYEARGRTLAFAGWKILTAQDQTEEQEDAEPDNPIPALKAGMTLQALSGEVVYKQTKPPARFTEASLVKELERRGIGRPSTYAAILDTILTRQYLEVQKRFLVPTILGEKVVSGLRGRFSFIEYDFTKTMEQSLDDIAERKANYQEVVSLAHDQLSQELRTLAKQTGKICPDCGKPLRRNTKPGQWDFWGCTGYPSCRYSENIGTTPVSPVSSSATQGNKKSVSAGDPTPVCPKCGKSMVRRKGAYGEFYGCSGYPGCKEIVKIQ